MRAERSIATRKGPGLSPRGWSWLTMLACCGLALLLNGWLNASAEEESVPEYEFKAALLHRFAVYTSWPASTFPSPEAPIRLGILGENPFGAILQSRIDGKAVAGRHLVVVPKRFGDDIRDCQMLFVCRSEKEHLAAVLGELKGKPILTLSELEEFTQDGGMIRFFLAGKRVRFEVKASAVEAAGLQISSKLSAYGVLIK